jgi:hypothetical protein
MPLKAGFPDLTNQSLRAPDGRAGSVERTRLSGCTRRSGRIGLWRFLPPRVAGEAVETAGREGGGKREGGGRLVMPADWLVRSLRWGDVRGFWGGAGRAPTIARRNGEGTEWGRRCGRRQHADRHGPCGRAGDSRRSSVRWPVWQCGQRRGGGGAWGSASGSGAAGSAGGLACSSRRAFLRLHSCPRREAWHRP